MTRGGIDVQAHSQSRYSGLPGVYLEIDQVVVARPAMTLDRKAPTGVGRKTHHCGRVRCDLCLDVVAVQMQHPGFVAGPIKLQPLALVHPNRLILDGHLAVLNHKFNPLDRRFRVIGGVLSVIVFLPGLVCL